GFSRRLPELAVMCSLTLPSNFSTETSPVKEVCLESPQGCCRYQPLPGPFGGRRSGVARRSADLRLHTEILEVGCSKRVRASPQSAAGQFLQPLPRSVGRRSSRYGGATGLVGDVRGVVAAQLRR